MDETSPTYESSLGGIYEKMDRLALMKTLSSMMDMEANNVEFDSRIVNIDLICNILKKRYNMDTLEIIQDNGISSVIRTMIRSKERIVKILSDERSERETIQYFFERQTEIEDIFFTVGIDEKGSPIKNRPSLLKRSKP